MRTFMMVISKRDKSNEWKDVSVGPGGGENDVLHVLFAAKPVFVGCDYILLQAA